ncbi:MAG: alanine racemase [Candidatus Buchananbacteria bacterium]
MNEITWLEISKKALQNNVSEIKRVLGETKLAVNLKANAYGHGLAKIAPIFEKLGANWFCVNSAEELSIIRKSKVNLPVLITGHTLLGEIKEVIKLNGTFTISSLDSLKMIARESKKSGKTAHAHIKIDTGMSRQGIMPNEINEFLRLWTKNISIEGVCTHFATADEKLNNDYFNKQLDIFNKCASNIEKGLGKKLIKHYANSAGALIYPQARMNMARVGISAYGYYPSPEAKKILKNKIKLTPALSLKTIISAIKTIPENSRISYGCTYKTTKPTIIAILPIGYYDGLDRKLSNCGEVLISGQKAKILGRICMNHTIVDISKIKNVKSGDEAVIIGKQGSLEITAENLAQKIGTINYEIITRIRENTPKYYL